MPGGRGQGGGGGQGGGRGRGGGGGGGGGGGRGRGRGMGGRGCGGGRGQGGRGRQWAQEPSNDRPLTPPAVSPPVPPASSELERLRQQAGILEQELESVRSRIAELDAQPAAQVAIVDETLCTLCGVCVTLCPTGAITMENVVRIDPQKCTGCAVCVRECPSEAIQLGPVAS